MNYPLRLITNTSIILLFLKLWFLFTSNNQRKGLYLVSFIQDIFLLILIYLVFILLFKKFKSRKLEMIGRILFFIFFLVAAITAITYSFFLFDLVSFPINIFGITLQNISFFFEYFMNLKLVVGLPFGLLVLFWLSYYFPKIFFWKKFPVIIFILFSILFIPTIIRPAINPLVYSLQEQTMLLFTANREIQKLQSPTANPALKEEFSFLNRAFESIPNIKMKYKRIIVLVMEGINYKDFYSESQRDSKSFINRHSKNLVSYENYYTLNLDSFTSLIAMLHNIFIPYQAYVNEGKYNFINSYNNLIRFFNKNGYTTHFLTSYGLQQKRFIPALNEWSEVICLENIEHLHGYAKVTSNKIEFAAEDLAVYDDLIRILKNNSFPFIFQEMVYGHTSAWKEQTGIETIPYYNQYFNKLIKTLETNNMMDGTLLVLTSDHGPRDDAYQPENYKVPLIIWANDIENDNKNDFLGHIDFKDILMTYLTEYKTDFKRKQIFTLGNSGELIYGKITATNEFAFIHNRMLNDRTNLSLESVKAFNRSFQNYLNYFESLR